MNAATRVLVSVGVYIASIVMVNWLFAPAQLVQGFTLWSTPFGDLYLANLVVGFVFVLRDYAQREIGHKILLATLVAGHYHLFHGGSRHCAGQHYSLRAV